MKFVLMITGLAVSAGAFAGTWSVDQSGCEGFVTPGPPVPGLSYSGTVQPSKTSEFSMDITRSANTSIPPGFLTGTNSVSLGYWTIVRYTASPGEIVDTSATHTLTWERKKKAHLFASSSGPANYAEIKLTPEPWLAMASPSSPWGEDGTFMSGIPVYLGDGTETVNFTLYHVSGNIYEGRAASGKTYVYDWKLYWQQSMDSVYVLEVSGMFRRKQTATHVDGVALP